MVRATALINHFGSPSTSEVGLNFPPHRSTVAHGLSRFVAPTGTKGDHWFQLLPSTGTKGPHWYRLMPPTGTKGLCFPPFGMLKNTFGTGLCHQPVPMLSFSTG